MAYNARNIIVGAAALYFSASDSTQTGYGSGPALPAGPFTGNRSIAAYLEYTDPAAATPVDNPDWRHAGYTSEGLELAYEPDWTDIEVDQLLDSAKIFKTSMRASINTTLTEGNLENLLFAWGQGADTLDRTMGPDPDDTGPLTAPEIQVDLGIAAGGLGDEPVERALVAVGPAPRSPDGTKRERIYYARRVLSVDAVSVAVRRDEATVFPVSLRLLPDSNFPQSEYGFIRDRNLTA